MECNRVDREHGIKHIPALVQGSACGNLCQGFVPTDLPVPAAGSAATSFTITPPSSLAPGNYPFTVSATDGYVTIKTPATLQVGDFSLGLTPTSATVQATSATNFSLNIGDLFGYSQPVDLACSNLPTGASCNIEASSDLIVVNLSNVAVGTYTFTVTGTSNSLVHTATAQLHVISTPVVSFAPGQFTLSPAVVGGTSYAEVQLTNSGSAALSISNVVANSSGAAGTLSTSNTCNGTVAPGSACTITVTFAATAVGTVSGTLTISDNASPSPQTLPITAQGEDFSLQAAPGGSTTATAKAGQSGVFSLEITPNQFQGDVDLRCANLPPWANCTVESNVNVAGSAPVTFQVTVATAAASRHIALAGNSKEWPIWRPLLGPGLFGLLFVSGNRMRRRLRRRLPWSMAQLGIALLALAATLSSCGGGGSSTGGGGGSTSTPPGTYTLTISGTAGGVTHSLPLTLVVN